MKDQWVTVDFSVLCPDGSERRLTITDNIPGNLKTAEEIKRYWHASRIEDLDKDGKPHLLKVVEVKNIWARHKEILISPRPGCDRDTTIAITGVKLYTTTLVDDVVIYTVAPFDDSEGPLELDELHYEMAAGEGLVFNAGLYPISEQPYSLSKQKDFLYVSRKGSELWAFPTRIWTAQGNKEGVEYIDANAVIKAAFQ